MNMPKLSPLPLKTRGKNPFCKMWVWLTEIRKWELLEDWQYMLPDGRTVVIPKGFMFDGASVPRLLWGILSPTGLLFIPALIHDFGYHYDYIRVQTAGGIVKADKGKGQKHWDKLFYEVSMEVNEMKTLNALAWLALTLFGRCAWAKKHRQETSKAKRGLCRIVYWLLLIALVALVVWGIWRLFCF